MTDPIDRIEWRDAGALVANHYNPNLVMNQELRLLEFSILKSGWVHALMVTPGGVIIDGFHRRMLTVESKLLRAKYQASGRAEKCPCMVLDLPPHEAMMLTIRINRAKGSHVALRMSDIVKNLVDEHGCDRQEIAQGIGANLDEVDLLYQGSIFAAKNMKEYRYSTAWIPAESGK